MAIDKHGRRSGSARLARAGAVLALGGLGLAACATAPSRTSLGRASPDNLTAEGPSAGPPAGGYGSGLHGTEKPYQIGGIWYYPHPEPHYDVTGYASWYGQAFHNRHTADGEIFDQFGLSAAHKTLPLPSIVEVTNLDNGKSLQLRLNDRGPFVGSRVLDVSRAAAEKLGFAGQGLARVRVRYVGPAPAFSAPVTYAAVDPASSPTSARTLTDAPSPWRRPQGQVQARPLAPLSSPAPVLPAPASTAPVPAAPTELAASDTSRFAEPSVAWTPAASAAPLAAPGPAPLTPPAGSDLPDATDADAAQIRASSLAPPPRPVEMASLDTPPAVSPPPDPVPAAAPTLAPTLAPSVATAPAAATGGFSVQAGAFSNRDNAERAAAQLGASAAIRPLARGGVTLYRVVLAGYRDTGAAEAARARTVAAGFADARVVSAY